LTRGIVVGSSRCPSCGSEVKADSLMPGRESSLSQFPCPNCEAMIKPNARYRTVSDLMWVAFGYAILSGLILVCILAFAAPDVGVELADNDSLVASGLTALWISASVAEIASLKLHRMNRWEVARMRHVCQYCGSVLTYEDVGYCTNCGEPLLTTTEDGGTTNHYAFETKQAHIVKNCELVGTCLVCNLEMHADEALALCPHCSNAFHRLHLVMWVHVRELCPACGQHLGPSGIRELPHPNGR
jgi:hypothetical protein